MKNIKLILKSIINLKSSSFLDKGFYIEFDIDNLEREYYDINQNDFSYGLAFKSLFFSDVKSYFFMEIVNLFQDLMVGTYLNVPYRSYSQVFTTYLLKRLARHGFIDILSVEKDIEETNLAFFKSIIDPNFSFMEDYYVCMYDVRFYKIKSLKKDDLSYIFNTAKVLGIDHNIYNCHEKNGKIYLCLKKDLFYNK